MALARGLEQSTESSVGVLRDNVARTRDRVGPCRTSFSEGSSAQGCVIHFRNQRNLLPSADVLALEDRNITFGLMALAVTLWAALYVDRRVCATFRP
jgi:hypothetical protein